jgi:hypothetical protein
MEDIITRGASVVTPGGTTGIVKHVYSTDSIYKGLAEVNVIQKDGNMSLKVYSCDSLKRVGFTPVYNSLSTLREKINDVGMDLDDNDIASAKAGIKFCLEIHKSIMKRLDNLGDEKYNF